MTVNAQALPDVKVEAKAPVRAKLVEFEERRSNAAGGRFFAQTDFDKRAGSSMSDALRSSVAGLEIRRDASYGSRVYADDDLDAIGLAPRRRTKAFSTGCLPAIQ